MINIVTPMVVETAVLAVVVWCIVKVVRPRPATAHWMWLIVLVKFTLPPIALRPTISLPGVLVSRWAPFAVAEHPAARSLITAERPVADPPPVIESDEASRTAAVETTAGPKSIVDLQLIEVSFVEESHAAGTQSISPTTQLPTRPKFDAYTMPRVFEFAASHAFYFVLGAWLLGSFIFLIRSLLRISRFHCRVQHRLETPTWLSTEVQWEARALGIKPPRVLVVAGVATPLVWCFGPLKLIWPADMTGSAHREMACGMVIHELAHIRRRDHWIEWLAFLLSVVWWWNPVYWLVRRQLTESSDLCCDAWVMRLHPSGGRAYIESLIAGFERIPAQRIVPALSFLGGPRHRFERRMKMVMQRRLTTKCSVFTVPLLMALCALAIPRWTAPLSAQDELFDPLPDLAGTDDLLDEPRIIDPDLPDADDPLAHDLPADELLHDSDLTGLRGADGLGLPLGEDTSREPGQGLDRRAAIMALDLELLRLRKAMELAPESMILDQEEWNHLVVKARELRSAVQDSPDPISDDRLAELVAKVRALRVKQSDEVRARSDSHASTRVFRLKHRNADSMRRIVQSLLPYQKADGPRLVADAPTNSLIARGRGSQLKRIETIVSKFDVEQVRQLQGFEGLRLVHLRKRNANDIIRVLQELSVPVQVVFPSKQLAAKRVGWDLSHQSSAATTRDATPFDPHATTGAPIGVSGPLAYPDNSDPAAANRTILVKKSSSKFPLYEKLAKALAEELDPGKTIILVGEDQHLDEATELIQQLDAQPDEVNDLPAEEEGELLDFGGNSAAENFSFFVGLGR